MEKRLGVRKPIAVKVYMAGSGHRRRCRATDISTTGVFIETDSMSLVKGMPVDLIFILNRNGVIRVHRLPAVVARTTHRGAGMVLRKQPRRAQMTQKPSLSQ